MIHKRILYLAYYLKELDRKKFSSFLNHAHKETGKSKTSIVLDMLKSSLRYNISLLEYFQFNFYRLNPIERQSFAGTGYMYEYQLKMNPKAYRAVLEDKIKFLESYSKFVNHSYATLSDLEKDGESAYKLLNNSSGKIVLKSSSGQCGIGIEVKDCAEFDSNKLIKRLKETDNDFVEEYVVQHQDLMKLSPSGLNTLRIITQLNRRNEVEIIGARLRITINSSVDNMAAGNIAAAIDLETGTVIDAGVYSDITKNEEVIHPVTKVPIVGFVVPFWNESVNLVKNAALIDINNRSIGWDVAITDRGPELIEGNHDWCKLLWQLPAKKGLKSVLEKYII